PALALGQWTCARGAPPRRGTPRRTDPPGLPPQRRDGGGVHGTPLRRLGRASVGRGLGPPPAFVAARRHAPPRGGRGGPRPRRPLDQWTDLLPPPQGSRAPTP